MPSLPSNVRIGRNGRVGILKKVPRDLWQHPRYAGKTKVIERSTGTTDLAEGVRIAASMLLSLEREFAVARAGPEVRTDGSPGRPAVAALPGGRPVRARSRGGEETRRDILAVAMEEFAEKGLKGTRVDDLAAKMRTTKPMIYYHFGSKEKLYAAVMEEAYVRVRDKEQELRLDDLPPEQAMRRLVEVTFDHHAAHPRYVRLVCIENMERGRYISGRQSMVQRNAIAIETIRTLLERGEREGVFRSGINPWHLHLLISAFCFIRVSNRYTWNAVFAMDLWEKNDALLQREMIVEAVLRYVRAD